MGYSKHYQDFTYAEKLLDLIIEQAKKGHDRIWSLVSWDETTKVDFQYFTQYKNWAIKGYRVKMSDDAKFSDKNTRFPQRHEIVTYLSQFRLVGDDGSND